MVSAPDKRRAAQLNEEGLLHYRLRLLLRGGGCSARTFPAGWKFAGFAIMPKLFQYTLDMARDGLTGVSEEIVGNILHILFLLLLWVRRISSFGASLTFIASTWCASATKRA